MAALSSKSYPLKNVKDSGAFHGWLDEWIASLPEIKSLQGCEVVFEIRSGKRQKKFAAASALLKLAAEAASGHRDVWKYKGYIFSFLMGKYAWKGTVLHITASEALFLFKWLVEGDMDAYRTGWYCLRNLRKRYGKDFLAEAEKA
jgi:hypothetical protein